MNRAKTFFLCNHPNFCLLFFLNHLFEVLNFDFVIKVKILNYIYLNFHFMNLINLILFKPYQFLIFKLFPIFLK